MNARARRGFTLVEVLLALALVAIVIAAAGRGLAGSRHAAAAAAMSSGAMLSRDLGSDLVAREVRRAGYAPASTPRAAGGGAELELALRPGRPRGDAVTVRYVDDRLSGAPLQRDLTFEVGLDGRGVPQLYRRTASGSKQPLVEGVSGLWVAGWADAGGFHPRSELAEGTLRPWLLALRLASDGSDEIRAVAVPLPSRPPAYVTVVP